MMKSLRRLLGVFVMIAGILGLVLSLAGLVSVWVVKPTVVGYVNSTILTLENSISTSQKAMEVTGQALSGTVASVDALSSMLSTTATTVEETQPVLDQINLMMGDTMPSTLEAATESLKTAQQAAEVLDSAIKSLDSFRAVLSATPLLGAFVDLPEEAYNPEVPLADSLGELATTLETLPETFTDMSSNLDKADDNMVSIQGNLTTMSESVDLISKSLSEYEAMVDQSQSSMDDLKSMLANIQGNLTNILNGVAIVMSLFLIWLLAAQVVILSQGWELYQGTADRMES
jgi:methyl-accepting chemotaxis protein